MFLYSYFTETPYYFRPRYQPMSQTRRFVPLSKQTSKTHPRVCLFSADARTAQFPGTSVVYRHNSKHEIRPRFRCSKASVALALARQETPRLDPFSLGKADNKRLSHSCVFDPDFPFGTARVRVSAKLIARVGIRPGLFVPLAALSFFYLPYLSPFHFPRATSERVFPCARCVAVLKALVYAYTRHVKANDESLSSRDRGGLMNGSRIFLFLCSPIRTPS